MFQRRSLPALLTTCMPLCYVTLYNLYSYYFALSRADLVRLHFTSNYTLYNYYVTNKETLTLVLSGVVYAAGYEQVQDSLSHSISDGRLTKDVTHLCFSAGRSSLCRSA